MGKNRVIKILGRLIAGMVAHKILEKYTNKRESLNHLRNEIENYRDNIYQYIKEFNWNISDKKAIKQKALSDLIRELSKNHFNDVKFNMDEAVKLIEEILNDLFSIDK